MILADTRPFGRVSVPEQWVLPDFDKAPGEGAEEEPLGGVVGDEKGTGGFAAAGAAKHAFGGPEEAEDEGRVEREHEAVPTTDGGVPTVGERVGAERAEDEEKDRGGLGVEPGAAGKFFAEADA